ncbi:hypothetical protein ACWKWU_19910 [Chitinophaga lutea]
MRAFRFLALPCILLAASCSKSRTSDVRWLEKSQRQEVIVFKDDLPESAIDNDQQFFFQSRKLPDHVSRASESGLYYYRFDGDSIQLKTRGQKFYFKMSDDGKSFTIGRFFIDPGGMGDILTFEKQ